MDTYDLLSKITEEQSLLLADYTDRYYMGYRRGKNYRWILPTYKGKGRPRKEDYETPISSFTV